MGVRKEYMDVAWNIARKLINLSDKDRENIFGYSDVSRIIKNFSANKVEYKIWKYEEKLKTEEIKEGDVVKCNFLYKGIVSFIDYDENGEEIFEVIVGITDGPPKQIDGILILVSISLIASTILLERCKCQANFDTKNLSLFTQ